MSFGKCFIYIMSTVKIKIFLIFQSSLVWCLWFSSPPFGPQLIKHLTYFSINHKAPHPNSSFFLSSSSSPTSFFSISPVFLSLFTLSLTFSPSLSYLPLFLSHSREIGIRYVFTILDEYSTHNKNPKKEIGLQPENQKGKAAKQLEKSYFYQGLVTVG